MKRAILILTVFVLSAFNSVDSQNIKETLVSGKWFVESIQEKGQEPEKVADKEDEWLLFYSDGKIEQSSFGELVTREWEYDSKESIIKMKGKQGITFLRLIEITKEKLIVEHLEELTDSESLIITYTK